MINAEKWWQANQETEYQQSQVQGFLYECKDKKNCRYGNHVVKDLLKLENQVIWESGYYDGERYSELYIEMQKQIDVYRIGIVAKRYAEIINQSCAKPDTNVSLA